MGLNTRTHDYTLVNLMRSTIFALIIESCLLKSTQFIVVRKGHLLFMFTCEILKFVWTFNIILDRLLLTLLVYLCIQYEAEGLSWQILYNRQLSFYSTPIMIPLIIIY